MKKHKILYLLSISSFAIIISMLPVASAYAGDINEQESEVLEELKGPFEYNGQTYVPLPSYLQLAREYLLADNINLTPEQKGKAIVAIKANIEMAISKGFIVPFEEEPKKDPMENKDEGYEANTNGTNESSLIDENNKNEDKKSDRDSLKEQDNSTKESIISDSDKELLEDGTLDSKKIENKEENSKTEEVKTTDNHGLKEEGTQDKVGALTNGEQPDGLVTGGNEDFMIKDTGYHVNSIVIFLGILLVAMMGTSYYLLYQVIIAKQNES